jgi:hypothetical protein
MLSARAMNATAQRVNASVAFHQYDAAQPASRVPTFHHRCAAPVAVSQRAVRTFRAHTRRPALDPHHRTAQHMDVVVRLRGQRPHHGRAPGARARGRRGSARMRLLHAHVATDSVRLKTASVRFAQSRSLRDRSRRKISLCVQSSTSSSVQHCDILGVAFPHVFNKNEESRRSAARQGQ